MRTKLIWKFFHMKYSSQHPCEGYVLWSGSSIFFGSNSAAGQVTSDTYHPPTASPFQ